MDNGEAVKGARWAEVIKRRTIVRRIVWLSLLIFI